MPISPAVRDEIRARLEAVEREEAVRVVYACESGSRAWGFPSANSDYDVRFVYVRPHAWYLSTDLERRRDVVERPITDEIDLSGWDVRKALQLLAGSNVTLFEWLQSPVVYVEDEEVTDRLRALTRTCYSPRSAFYHYLNMARSIARRYLAGETIGFKRYFYILRPLLACRWIMHGRGIPPLSFEELCDTVLDDVDLRSVVDDLLERKRRGDELDVVPRIEALDAFIIHEMERLDEVAPTLERTKLDRTLVNTAFREIVMEIEGRGNPTRTDKAAVAHLYVCQ